MPSLIFHLIPHTHWDREWYRTEASFRPDLVACLDDLVARLVADPALRTFHLDGQSILLEDYLSLRPDARPTVTQLVREGRLVTGPSYVLADNQVPSAHAMRWNLRLGMRDGVRLGGREPGVAYLPDAFGHTGDTPDLLNEVGIGHAVVWRGTDSSQDLFRWCGPGGGEVLVYHLPPSGYEVGSSLQTGSHLSRSWDAVCQEIMPRASTRHVALFLGADHHWVHPDIPGLQRALACLEPTSEFRISTLEEFFAAVEADADRESLAIRTGALRDSGGYTWTLQGTLSTRAPLKRRSASLELWLERIVEPVVALAETPGTPSQLPLVDALWRTLLSTHFHDTLGGCCADGVARAMTQRMNGVRDSGATLLKRSLHRLLGHDPDHARAHPTAVRPSLIVWDPTGGDRGEQIVEASVTVPRQPIRVGPPSQSAPAPEKTYPVPTALVDPSGHIIPLQILKTSREVERVDADRHYPLAREVDRVWVAFRHRHSTKKQVQALEVSVTPSTPQLTGTVSVTDRSMTNQFLRVKVDDDGTLTVRDRHTREIYRGLAAWSVDPDGGDTYTYCPPKNPQEGALPVQSRLVSCRQIAPGPLIGGLEIRVALLIPGHGTVDGWIGLSITDTSRLIRLRMQVLNRAVCCRLRLGFPTGLSPAPNALAGSQLGTTERVPVQMVVAGTEVLFATAPTHRWLAVHRSGRGLGLFAPGFFESEWTSDGRMEVTILRMVGQLSRADLWTRPGHAGWPTPTPEAQCVGTDSLTLALAPFSVTPNATDLHRLWEEVMVPPLCHWIPDYVGGGHQERDLR